MGLKAAFEFFNQLRISDLRSAITQGDPSVLTRLPANCRGSIQEFREWFGMTPVIDVLKLLAPHRAAAIGEILAGIEALADFNQRLNNHLASTSALEPIHAVLCDTLRSGFSFAECSRRNPLSVATQAVSGICSHPDADASFFSQSSRQTQRPTLNTNNLVRRPVTRRSGRVAPAGRPVQRNNGNICFPFQSNVCYRPRCPFRHACARCNSPGHGLSLCPHRPT